MKDTTTLITGTLHVPAFADVSLLTTVAGVLVDFRLPVHERVGAALQLQVTDHHTQDDIVTFSLFGTTGWTHLDDMTISALAAVGVTGWLADDGETSIELLEDGTVARQCTHDLVDLDAIDALFC